MPTLHTKGVVGEEQHVMEERYNLPYNWIPKRWSRQWRGKNGLWTLAKSLAGEMDGKRVLDAGCGDGWYTARMIAPGVEAHGADYSERAIRFAREILPGGKFEAASIAKLPYPDKHFDTVFSFQVIEHIPTPELPMVVAELTRVLKDDGQLILSVPSTNRKLSRAHYQHFTIETLSKTFDSSFSVEKSFGQERHTPVLHILERLLENRLWVLPEIAERFNRGAYLRHFNKTTPQAGQNLVALLRKK